MQIFRSYGAFPKTFAAVVVKAPCSTPLCHTRVLTHRYSHPLVVRGTVKRAQLKECDILGYPDGKNADCGLLGCDAMWPKQCVTFQNT
jgi:hypothetical protein